MLQPQLESSSTYAKELGLQYVVCSSPSLEDPSRVKLSPKDPGYHEAWVQAFTLDDWKWNAEQYNQIGSHGQSPWHALRLSQSHHRISQAGQSRALRRTDAAHRSRAGHLRDGLRMGGGRRIQPGGISDEVSDANLHAACEGLRPQERHRASAVHGTRSTAPSTTAPSSKPRRRAAISRTTSWSRRSSTCLRWKPSRSMRSICRT